MDIQAILQCCVEICRADKNVKRLILFGSHADGTSSANSDIDLCLDTNYDIRDPGLYALCSKITRTCCANFDLLQYNYIAGKIKREIDQNGKVLYDVCK